MQLSIDFTANYAPPVQPERAKNTWAIRKPAEPRYRNSVGQTWTGRGHKPQWLQDAIAAGAQLEDFRILENV